MAEIENLISIYHNLYLICLVLAIVCLIATVFLFIFLDIKNVWMTLSGRAEKKAIKQMSEETVFTSQLARRRRSKYAGKMVSPSGQLAMPEGGRQTLIDPPPRRTEEPLIQAAPAAEPPTEPLQATYKTETTILKKPPLAEASIGMETELLSDKERFDKNRNAIAHVRFMLERQIMMVHTEESI